MSKDYNYYVGHRIWQDAFLCLSPTFSTREDAFKESLLNKYYFNKDNAPCKIILTRERLLIGSTLSVAYFMDVTSE